MEIIPREVLEAKLDEIDRKINNSDLQSSLEMGDEFEGNEFKFYLLFKNWPSLLAENGYKAGSELIFYNRYYWFVYFLKLYTAKHGYDAGLEQRAFQLLEESEALGIEVDWELIAKIESEVGRGTAL